MPRTLPPASAYQKSGRVRAHLPRVRRAAGTVLGTYCRGIALVQKMGQRSGVELPVGQVVLRRPIQSLLKLSRSPCSNLALELSGDVIGVGTGCRKRGQLCVTHTSN